MSKELELCMNQLIKREKITRCTDINFWLLNMKGIFHSFYSIKINEDTTKMIHKIGLCW